MDMALALTHGQNLKIMTSRDSREVEHQRQQQQQQGARRRDETRPDKDVGCADATSKFIDRVQRAVSKQSSSDRLS